MDNERCIGCNHWIYSERIEKKYGMGTGLCEIDKEAKGCDRNCCLLFEERKGNG